MAESTREYMDTVKREPLTPKQEVELIIFNGGLFDDRMKPDILLLKLRFISRHLTREDYAELKQRVSCWFRDDSMLPSSNVLFRQIPYRDYESFMELVNGFVEEELDAMLKYALPGFTNLH